MLDDQPKEQTKAFLYRWGKWAGGATLQALNYPDKSAHLLDHNHYHEGDYPTEERVEEALNELGEFDPLAREVTVLYYTGVDEKGQKLSWDQVAERVGCGLKKVRAAHNLAIGYVAKCLGDMVCRQSA